MSQRGGSILIADRDGRSRAALTERLRAERHLVSLVATLDEALAAIAGSDLDLLLLDPGLANGDGVALLGRVRRVDPDLAVVLLATVGQSDSAVAAMSSGAAAYLVKPVDPVELSLVVNRELERRWLRRETAAASERLAERYRFPGVIGDAPAMQQLYKAMVQAAAMPAALLIAGEPGTGKALIAGAVHRRSPRAGAPMVRLTGDAPLAAGCQAASGGSLLVEEISDLPPPAQLELVQILERQGACGATHRPLAIDVRILAATGRNLQAEVARGRFRPDLADRLRQLHLHVPPLRERASDVPALALHFLDKYTAEARKVVSGFAPEAMARLRAHPWPGNVRELEQVVERAVARARGRRVTAAELPPDLQLCAPVGAIPIPGWTLEQLERHAILETMKATGGSTGKTAHLLGISVRNVQYKLRAYRADKTATDLRAGGGGDAKVA